jgi:hypothetical protein
MSLGASRSTPSTASNGDKRPLDGAGSDSWAPSASKRYSTASRPEQVRPLQLGHLDDGGITPEQVHEQLTGVIGHARNPRIRNPGGTQRGPGHISIEDPPTQRPQPGDRLRTLRSRGSPHEGLHALYITHREVPVSPRLGHQPRVAAAQHRCQASEAVSSGSMSQPGTPACTAPAATFDTAGVG